MQNVFSTSKLQNQDSSQKKEKSFSFSVAKQLMPLNYMDENPNLQDFGNKDLIYDTAERKPCNHKDGTFDDFNKGLSELVNLAYKKDDKQDKYQESFIFDDDEDEEEEGQKFNQTFLCKFNKQRQEKQNKDQNDELIEETLNEQFMKKMSCPKKSEIAAPRFIDKN